MRIMMKEEVVRWAYMEVPDEKLEDWEIEEKYRQIFMNRMSHGWQWDGEDVLENSFTIAERD